MDEAINGLRYSISEVSQNFQVPKTWIGSASVNVLRILNDVICLVESLNIKLSEHVHTNIGQAPQTAAAFIEDAFKLEALSSELTSVTLKAEPRKG